MVEGICCSKLVMLEGGLDPQADVVLQATGHMEIAVRERSVTIGQFPGSIYLFYAAEALANAVARLREGYVRFEVPLVADSASLWLATPGARPGDEVAIVYRDFRSDLVSRKQFDLACEQGITAFLGMLSERVPVSPWDSDAVRLVEVVASVWPSMSSSARLMLDANDRGTLNRARTALAGRARRKPARSSRR